MSDRALAWMLQIAGVLVVVVAVLPVVTALLGLVMAQGPLVSLGFGRALVGSLALCGLAMLVALPLGVAAGVHLSEYAASSPLIHLVRGLLRTTAAIPSVVVGVFAGVVFAGMLEVHQPLLVASFALGLLVLPGVAGRTEASLRLVPEREREAALALGASRSQVLWWVALPAASGGILSGAFVALARAFGATAPLLVLGVGESFGALPHRLFVAGPGRETWLLVLLLTLLPGALAWFGENLQRRSQP